MSKQKRYVAHAPDTTTCECYICSESVAYAAKGNGATFKDKLVNLVGFSSENHWQKFCQFCALKSCIYTPWLQKGVAQVEISSPEKKKWWISLTKAAEGLCPWQKTSQ